MLAKVQSFGAISTHQPARWVAMPRRDPSTWVLTLAIYAICAGAVVLGL